MLEKIENYLKNITKKDFVYLIVFSLLMDLAAILWSIFYTNDLIENIEELIFLSETENMLNMTSIEIIWMILISILIIVVIILSLLSLIGILKFKNWGRKFYIYTFILSLFLVLMPGIYITTMPELVLSSIASVTSGIIFILMFTDPIKKYFK